MIVLLPVDKSIVFDEEQDENSDVNLTDTITDGLDGWQEPWMN